MIVILLCKWQADSFISLKVPFAVLTLVCYSAVLRCWISVPNLVLFEKWMLIVTWWLGQPIPLWKCLWSTCWFRWVVSQEGHLPAEDGWLLAKQAKCRAGGGSSGPPGLPLLQPSSPFCVLVVPSSTPSRSGPTALFFPPSAFLKKYFSGKDLT